MDEALIIGGGPAGASLAIRLAAAGRHVRLIERERGPHDKVCGEFLSFEAVAYLNELGVDAQALGAVPIDEVEVVCGADRSRAPLPFRALSLSRRIMDEALLARAEALGARIERGRRVSGLTFEGGAWRAGLDGGGALSHRRVFLATGKHDIRGWRRPPGPQSDLIGFKQHFTLAGRQARDLEGRVQLHLFAGGYAGFEPVGADRANLCLVVRRSAFKALGRSWPALLAALLEASHDLAARLEGAQPATPRPMAIGAIPYGHVARPAGGPWRLGDQAAVIPSFCGEGMSIALHSARLAAEIELGGGGGEAYQRRLAMEVGPQVVWATLLSRAVVRASCQGAISALVGAWPAALARIAAATRIGAPAVAH
jgi:flavin-dependent dehydrogenase